MTAAYLRVELRRLARNPRILIFTLILPLVLFLFLGGGRHQTLGGLPVPAYIMVSMATLGAMNSVFTTGGRIAVARSTGWHRQLRLTAMTGGRYVAAMVATGFAVAVPAVVAVFAAGAVIDGVSLGAARWLAVAASVLVSLLPIAALGVWIGYLARADGIQALAGGVSSLLSLLGGLWIPVESFPHWLADGVQALPMYWIAQAGRSALAGGWVGWPGAAVIAGWTAVLTVLAARAYRRDTARP
jgi:ABC-2 type transport system permease protein